MAYIYPGTSESSMDIVTTNYQNLFVWSLIQDAEHKSNIIFL